MAEDTQAISSGAGVVPVPYDGRSDCKLCKNMARDAVVSFCGHLFCWSCLAQHLKRRCRFCPVCHEQVSAKKVIPVYGGGGGGKQVEAADGDGLRPRPGPPLVIVKRPHPTKPSVPAWLPIPEGEDVRAYLRLKAARKAERLRGAIERNRATDPEFEFTSDSYDEMLRLLHNF